MTWNDHPNGNGAGPRTKRIVRGGPRLRSAAIVVAVLTTALAAFHVFTFQVQPDELGVVLRFGNVVRVEGPGLHFRMPHPIDEISLPKATRQNIVEVGLRTDQDARSSALRPGRVSEESLMLTADENIVDVTFVVFWRIRDAQEYLFNVREPDDTVKAVAESAMREVIGQSNIQPILTRARQDTEQAVRTLMQDVLDRYTAGIRIDHVQLQRIDPPAQVIDAFRDVQAAATDKETLQNQARAYAGRVVPEARGNAERILETAKAFRQEAIADAEGQTTRFLKIQNEYQKAPGVTARRLHLETMERVLARADKILVDPKAGSIPYLSLWPWKQETGK